MVAYRVFTTCLPPRMPPVTERDFATLLIDAFMTKLALCAVANGAMTDGLQKLESRYVSQETASKVSLVEM